MNYTIDQLRYPIGKYHVPAPITETHIADWTNRIAQLPQKFKSAISGLDETQLDTPYREGGWTLRQVVHHVADSHINAYIRFKLAITEENPVIRPYFEERWAECREAKNAPVNISLALLDNLHQRWVLFINSLEAKDFERSYIHPEHKRVFTLKEITGMYSWHGEHHLHHILLTKKRLGW